MRGWLLVGLVGGACGEPRSGYTVSRCIDEYTGDAELKTCGWLEPTEPLGPIDAASARAAADCALAAHANAQAFLVRWVEPGIEGETELAYVGAIVDLHRAALLRALRVTCVRPS